MERATYITDNSQRRQIHGHPSRGTSERVLRRRRAFARGQTRLELSRDTSKTGPCCDIVSGIRIRALFKTRIIPITAPWIRPLISCHQNRVTRVSNVIRPVLESITARSKVGWSQFRGKVWLSWWRVTSPHGIRIHQMWPRGSADQRWLFCTTRCDANPPALRIDDDVSRPHPLATIAIIERPSMVNGWVERRVRTCFCRRHILFSFAFGMVKFLCNNNLSLIANGRRLFFYIISIKSFHILCFRIH